MPEFDLLVVGEINPDLVLCGDNLAPAFGQAEKLVEAATLTIGSSSAIMACGAARLGLRVAFAGIVGDDVFGHFMLEAMAARGIDVSACIIDRTLATGFSVILSQPHDRAILTHLGAIAALQARQIDPTMLRRARHLHVGSYFLLDALRPDLPDLYAQAHQAGLTTSLDTNWDPRGDWDGGLARLLTECDILLPNETEATLIAQCNDLDKALDVLADRVSILAVKLGADGALARHGDRLVRAPALPVPVIDTTGAGDSFDAGFLYGYLNDWSLERTLELACACGSLSTRAAGGTEGQATLAEAIKALEKAQDERTRAGQNVRHSR
jgi:sugar/nucleoside kinase (ribokinase family)